MYTYMFLRNSKNKSFLNNSLIITVSLMRFDIFQLRRAMIDRLTGVETIDKVRVAYDDMVSIVECIYRISLLSHNI